jgi:hypothetical protein
MRRKRYANFGSRIFKGLQQNSGDIPTESEKEIEIYDSGLGYRAVAKLRFKFVRGANLAVPESIRPGNKQAVFWRIITSSAWAVCLELKLVPA